MGDGKTPSEAGDSNLDRQGDGVMDQTCRMEATVVLSQYQKSCAWVYLEALYDGAHLEFYDVAEEKFVNSNSGVVPPRSRLMDNTQMAHVMVRLDRAGVDLEGQPYNWRSKHLLGHGEVESFS